MRLLLLSLLLLMVSVPVVADSSSMHYGYLGSIQWIVINDPDGNTEEQAVLVPLGGFVSFDASRDLRYRVDLAYLSGSLNAGPSQVGQDYTSMMMVASVNWRLRFNRTWKPWVGAGVAISQSEFTTRYTVDSEGFLLNKYPDRSQTGYAATIMASNYWELNRSVQLGVEAMVDIPLSTESLRRFGIGVSVLF